MHLQRMTDGAEDPGGHYSWHIVLAMANGRLVLHENISLISELFSSLYFMVCNYFPKIQTLTNN